MAGDEYPHEAAETAPPMVDDPFPSIADKLSELVNAVRMVDWEIIGPISTAAATASGLTSQYPKLRVQTVIISTDIATIATLVVGTIRYPFAVVAGINRFPFPLLIERGTNVSVEFAVAVSAHCYMLGPVE
jgi:hypothetical protein